MSNNIEFISAGVLPTTEAEEVDVLCVENGELKRKAGATLGGGGGFYRVILTPENCNIDGNPVMCTENYDELAKALESGYDVNIVLSAELTEEFALSMRVMAWTFMEGFGVVCGVFNVMAGDPMLIVFPNGSYIPQIG